MPAYPWMGSGSNSGLIRFRVLAYTYMRVWRTVDKIYQWTSSAPKITADFAGGNRLPTSLDGVRVNINGRAAFVSYVSPGQLNVLAPDDSAVVPVTVEVINSAGQAQATAQMAGFAPGGCFLTTRSVTG